MLPGRRSLAALALLAVGCAAVSPTHPRFLRVGNACASSFDEATDQIGGTWCCWILSALEGARAQRILTADNLCNKFGASFDFQAKRIPKWQELAQAKMAEDSSCYYGGGEGTWQKKITPATMGCNRQDKLPLKFAKLGLQMTTDKFKDVYTVEATTSEAKAPDFFMGQPPAGHAYIYTVDREGANGHAMAVRGIAKDGKKYVLSVFNQGSQRSSTWTISPKKRTCKSGGGNTCSTIYRFVIANPAPGFKPRPPEHAGPGQH